MRYAFSPLGRATAVALLTITASVFWGPCREALGQGAPDIEWVGGGTAASVVSVSPNGQTLATANPFSEEVLKLWRTDGTFVMTVGEGLFAAYHSLAFSPNGQYLAAGHEGSGGSSEATALIFRVSDGALIRGLNPGDANGFYGTESVAWSPDGALIAIAYDAYRNIELYDAASGALVRSFPGGGHTVVFSPDGTKIAGPVNGSVRVWNVADGSVVRTLSSPGTLLAYSPDGQFLAVGTRFVQNADVKLFRTADGGLERTITPSRVQYLEHARFAPAGPGAALLAIAGYRDAAAPNEELSLFSDEVIQGYRTDGGLAWTYEHEHGIAFSIGFAPDGQTLMVAGGWRTAAGGAYVEGGDDSIQKLRASDGVELAHFAGARGVALGVAFSSDSQFFAVTGGTTTQVWRVADGTVEHTLPTPGVTVAFSADASRLAIPNGSPIQIWTRSNYLLEKTLPGHAPFPTNAAVFSPDGTLVGSGGDDNTAKLWRVSDGSLVWSRPSSAGAVRTVAFSPDGQYLAGGCGSYRVRLWRVSDGSLIRTFTGQNAVDSIAFSPDGTMLAVGEEFYGDNLKLYRVSDGTLLHAYPGSQGFQHQTVSFTADNAFVAFSSGGQFIQYWRTGDGTLAREYDRETGTGQFQFMPLAISPDGRHMGYGRQDFMVVMARNPFAPEPGCGPADLGRQGGVPGADGFLDNNDFVVFIDLFFSADSQADVGVQGGLPGADGLWDNNDFVVFIDQFFTGC